MNIFKNLNKDKVLELKFLGYTKIGNLDSEVLKELKSVSEKLVDDTKKKYPQGELFNLINSDLQTKLASNEIVDQFLNPYLKSVFDVKKVDIHPVSHLIKPFGLKSGIWHQDSSIVDESKDFSLNAWTSLVDTGKLNGCLWILPGSHINGNHFRQFGFNPIQGELLKKINKFLIPVKTKAGEVLVFHRNIIHGSSRNWLPFDRIALESIIVPKNVQFYNFHRDVNLCEHKILGFKVDMEHFLGATPKEDFYNGKYEYVEIDDWGREKITRYLMDSLPEYVNHANRFYDENF